MAHQQSVDPRPMVLGSAEAPALARFSMQNALPLASLFPYLGAGSSPNQHSMTCRPDCQLHGQSLFPVPNIIIHRGSASPKAGDDTTFTRLAATGSNEQQLLSKDEDEGDGTSQFVYDAPREQDRGIVASMLDGEEPDREPAAGKRGAPHVPVAHEGKHSSQPPRDECRASGDADGLETHRRASPQMLVLTHPSHRTPGDSTGATPDRIGGVRSPPQQQQQHQQQPFLAAAASTARRRSSNSSISVPHFDPELLRSATATLQQLVEVRSTLMSSHRLRRDSAPPTNANEDDPASRRLRLLSGSFGDAAAASLSVNSAAHNIVSDAGAPPPPHHLFDIDEVVSYFLENKRSPVEERLHQVVQLAKELYTITEKLEAFSTSAVGYLSSMPPTLCTFTPAAAKGLSPFTSPPPDKPCDDGEELWASNRHEFPEDDRPFGQFGQDPPGGLDATSAPPPHGGNHAVARKSMPPIKLDKRQSLGVSSSLLGAHQPLANYTVSPLLGGLEVPFLFGGLSPRIAGGNGHHRVAKSPGGAMMLHFLSATEAGPHTPRPLVGDEGHANEDDLLSMISCNATNNPRVDFARSERAHFREDGGFEIINDYMLLDELGRGATGAVFLAIHQVTDEPFAIKSMSKVRARRAIPARRASASFLGGSGHVESSARLSPVPLLAAPCKGTSDTIAAEMVTSVDSTSHSNAQQQDVHPHEEAVTATTPSPMAASQDAKKAALFEETHHQGITSNPIEREINIMRSIKHPNLVTLHEVIDDDDEQQIHLVMDYCRFGPLVKILSVGSEAPLGGAGTGSRRPSLSSSIGSGTGATPRASHRGKTIVTSVVRPISKLALFTKQICAGLRYLHKLDIVHRDIKPDNILIAEDDLVKISDFGESAIAAKLDGAENGIPTVGTPAFLAPELCGSHHHPDEKVKGTTSGKEADIWAFGITIYAALVGRLPFYGTSFPAQCRSIVKDMLVFPPLSELTDAEHIDDATYSLWRDLLTLMLQKRPHDRASLRLVAKHPAVVGVADADRSILERLARKASLSRIPSALQRTSSIIKQQQLERQPPSHPSSWQVPPQSGGSFSGSRVQRTSATQRVSLMDNYEGTPYEMVVDGPPHQNAGEQRTGAVDGGSEERVDDVVPQHVPSPPKHGSPSVPRSSVAAGAPSAINNSDDDDDASLDLLRLHVHGHDSAITPMSSRNAARVVFVSEQRRRAVIHHASHLGVESAAGGCDGSVGLSRRPSFLVAQQQLHHQQQQQQSHSTGATLRVGGLGAARERTSSVGECAPDLRVDIPQ